MSSIVDVPPAVGPMYAEAQARAIAAERRRTIKRDSS